MKTVDPRLFHQQFPNPLILDVRTKPEFDAAHIPGSVHAPLHELNPDQVKSLLTDDKQICIVCRSGNRARQAAQKLSDAGHPPPPVLEGGIEAWKAAGLPLNIGRNSMSIERQVRIAAGTLVLVGVILGTFLHPAAFALSAFVGAGLVFAGLTDWCGMGLLLARMPWNR
jgi:rhodanese-related sulfurtransferase